MKSKLEPMNFERSRRSSTDSEKSSSNQSFSPSTPIPMETNSSLFELHSFSCPTENLLSRLNASIIDLNPFFQCSLLPSHWRKNKSLQFVIRAKPNIEIKSKTRVVLLAGNDHNPSASMKNNITWFHDNQATFTDLRFLTVSGRGKKFNLNILIETCPAQQITFRRAIKITVDGPRKKRKSSSSRLGSSSRPKQTLYFLSEFEETKSDSTTAASEHSTIDETFDDETRMTLSSNKRELNDVRIQESSALFLLASVAEKKWLDERASNGDSEENDRQTLDESTSFSMKSAPKDITHSLNCLSPTLIGDFAQSIKFSPTDAFTALSLQNQRPNLPFKSNNFHLD